MYILNEDLEFLIHLESKLGRKEGWSKDVHKLWALVERLIQQRSDSRKKTRELIAKRRITDKQYGRSKRKDDACEDDKNEC